MDEWDFRVQEFNISNPQWHSTCTLFRVHQRGKTISALRRLDGVFVDHLGLFPSVMSLHIWMLHLVWHWFNSYCCSESCFSPPKGYLFIYLNITCFQVKQVNKYIEEKEIPTSWQTSVIVPIWKGKGNVTACTSY